MKALLVVLATFLLIVAVLAGLIYVVLGLFWLAFIGLTMLYTSIATVVLLVIASYYHKKKERTYKAFRRYLRNNNTWFWVLCWACALTFVVACFHFGPALALPTSKATGTVYHDATYVFQHILFGNKAASMGLEPPTDNLPWNTGTWFWWKALGLYILLTFAYIPFAFYDEAVATFHFIKEEIRKHHNKALEKKRAAHTSLIERLQEINNKRKKNEPEIPLPGAPPDKLHFEQFMEIGVVIEILFSVIKFIKEMKVKEA